MVMAGDFLLSSKQTKDYNELHLLLNPICIENNNKHFFFSFLNRSKLGLENCSVPGNDWTDVLRAQCLTVGWGNDLLLSPCLLGFPLLKS